MAQMLVRVVDKIHADPYLNAGATKAGDVIEIVPDEHVFSELEKTAPHWTIVSVPGVDPELLDAFKAPEPGVSAENRMLQKRAFALDLDMLAAAAAPLTLAAVLAAKVRKPALEDPNVFAAGEPHIL